MKKLTSLTETHTFALSYDDSCLLILRANQAGLTISDYIRRELGFLTLAEIKGLQLSKSNINRHN